MAPRLSYADIIWNRACMERGGPSPRIGDRALAAMLRVHGLIMNGGIEHAVECLPKSEIAEGMSGYRFFGLATLADIILTYDPSDAGDDGSSELDVLYETSGGDDSDLYAAFKERFDTHPDDFAPVVRPTGDAG